MSLFSKMGRPTLDPSQKMSVYVSLTMTTTMRASIAQAAAASGKTIASWSRDVLSEAATKHEMPSVRGTDLPRKDPPVRAVLLARPKIRPDKAAEDVHRVPRPESRVRVEAPVDRPEPASRPLLAVPEKKYGWWDQLVQDAKNIPGKYP